MEVTVKFVDFWPTFNHVDNKFVRALEARHHVTVLTDDDPRRVPDLLFYSCFGISHLRYDCLRIYYTGENDVPDFNICDYALSFVPYDFGGRNLRYPLYLMYEYADAVNRKPLERAQALDRGFCSLLMRNANNCDPMRLRIIDAVDAYKPLAYGGPFRNNVGSRVDNKIEFIGGYKFNLALENSIQPGYVTEKIVEPFAARTVPIYWGDAQACRDFNPEAFVNASDFDTLGSLVREIDRLDHDDEAYLHMLNAPAVRTDAAVDFDARLSEFLCGIAESGECKTARYGQQHVEREYDRLLRPLMAHALSAKAVRLLDRLRR